MLIHFAQPLLVASVFVVVVLVVDVGVIDRDLVVVFWEVDFFDSQSNKSSASEEVLVSVAFDASD